MSDRLLEAMNAQAEARERLDRARKLWSAAMERLDEVYGVVGDGFEPDEDDLEALADLPDEDLHEQEQLAEEYAETVRDFARAARKARELKARRSQGS